MIPTLLQILFEAISHCFIKCFNHSCSRDFPSFVTFYSCLIYVLFSCFGFPVLSCFYSMLYIRNRNQRWKIPEVGGGSHGGSHLCDPPAEHHDRCRLAVAVPPFWDLQRQFVVAWNGDFPRFLGENHGPKGICVGVMFFFLERRILTEP